MVNEIIPNQMPSDDKTQDSLKTAAKAWRLPYWDWAANNEVPLLAQDQEIEVFTKFGTAKIKNALYQYNLPQGKTFGTMGPASNQTYTLVSADGVPASISDRGQWELPVATGRCPPTFGSNATAFQAGTVDNGQVAKNIRNHEWYSKTEDDPTLRESVYRLLTYDVPYEVFATTNMDPSDVEPLGYLNCEYIHNNVHNWVGGAAGQMGDVPVAAYDPIFFLHHCNIDRLYAIWQTLYPQKWFRATKVLKDNGTWSIPTDNPDTQCTQLAPFRPNNSGTYYTPDTVREWMQFGYSYPELQPWKYKTTEDYLLSINTDIAKLYRATADHISDSYEIGTDKDIVHYDHVINIRYGKYDLGGLPYIIKLYLRRQGSDHEDESTTRPTQSPLHPIPTSTHSTPPDLVQPPSLDGTAFIGSVYNFSTATGPQGTNTRCANCAAQQAKETLSTAQIPITSFLVKIAGERSWAPDTMIPVAGDGEDKMVEYLDGGLTWKVFKKGGEEVPLDLLPNLRTIYYL
ncbi:hypothetical protein MGN70_002530 [Eutypa lata]|nr:hypothetical protein MGN70_002530 [Eutypa lata]